MVEELLYTLPYSPTASMGHIFPYHLHFTEVLVFWTIWEQIAALMPFPLNTYVGIS